MSSMREEAASRAMPKPHTDDANTPHTDAEPAGPNAPGGAMEQQQPQQLNGAALIRLLRALARGETDPSAVSAPDAKALLAHCLRRVRADQARIEAAVGQGRMSIARREQFVFIGSLAARLVAAKEAWKKRRPPDGSPPAFGTIWDTAEAIRALNRPASPRVWKKQKRRDGAWRPICEFEPEDKARQHLLRLALTPFASIHHAQFGLRRGRSAACGYLRQAMGRAEPNSCVLLTDVKDFFGSISHDWLEEFLPFPKGVTRGCITTGCMSFTPTGRGLARPTGEEIKQLGGGASRRVRRSLPWLPRWSWRTSCGA